MGETGEFRESTDESIYLPSDVDPDGFHRQARRWLSHVPSEKHFPYSYSDPFMASPYTMTEAVLWERAQQHNSGVFSTQLFACFTGTHIHYSHQAYGLIEDAFAVTLGAVSTGYLIGSTSPKIRAIYDHTEAGKYYKDASRFASVVALGLAMGNIFMAILSVTKGPRKIMLFAAPLNFLAYLLMPLLFDESYQSAMMFCCAFLSVHYVANGALLLLDVIHDTFYYTLFMIFRSGHGFGVLLGCVFGLSKDLVYYADGFGAAILCSFIVALIFCPESPVFLYAKNPLLAEKAMVFFRGTADIRIIMRQIAKDHQTRVLDVGAKVMILRPVVYKAMFIILGVAILQVMYAYHIFLLYSFTMWSTPANARQVGIIGEYADGVLLGFGYFLVPLVTNGVHLRLTFGIRKPMLLSAIMTPIALCLHAFYFRMLTNESHADYVGSHHELMRWCRWIIRFFHIVSFNIGHSVALETMITDYLPEQVQVWASIFIISLKYLMVSVLLWITFHLEAVMDGTYIIMIYAMISFAGIPFCYYFIVESKGRSLQQIQLALGGNPIGSRSTFRNRYKKTSEEYQRESFT